MTMNRRDQLSNAIYQRMKQLQARLNRRNAEEQRRQDKAEKAKIILWEEHQRQLLQFEKYLKRMSPCWGEGRRPRTCRSPRTPHNTECRTPVQQEDIVLDERTTGSRSTVTSPTISSFDQSNGLARTTSTVTAPAELPEPEPSSPGARQATPLEIPQVVPAPEHSTGANSYRSGNWHGSSHATSPLLYEKSALARGLEHLEWEAAPAGGSLHSQDSNNVFSNDLSPPPTLPSTPSQCTPLLQTPPPPVETPVINFEIDSTQMEGQALLPDISVTKLTVTTPDLDSKQDVSTPRKKKKPAKPKKKKLVRKNASMDLGLANALETPDKVTESKIDKKEAQQQIKAIFKNANSLPEEELTEEAFSVFLDTIKQLSEYVEHDDVDSQNYEVVDGISSGFSSRMMELGDESSERTQSPTKTCTTPSPVPNTKSPTPKLTRGPSQFQVKKQQAEERRRQRILVVKEKQEGIIRYRKVTMAELRLRRQRALMRVRSKLQDDLRERNTQDMQRLRLFELVSLNEQERLARLAQFKQETEEKEALEAEARRLKELKVKAELEQLLEKSRRRQLEEEQSARRNRECQDIEEQDDEECTSELKQELNQKEVAKKVTVKWKSAARRARNRELYDQMIRKNSSNLYRNLMKELIMQTQASLITEIPGFSYFLLLKYTLDPEEVEEIMMDM